MALHNFSLATGAPSPFLQAPIGTLNAAPVNSFLYTHGTPPLPPPSPPRRATTIPRTSSINNPYSQQEPRYQPQQRTPRYYSNDNYKSNISPPPTTKNAYPSQPAGYAKVESSQFTSQPGTKTSVHAVLDYDDDFDDYYDDEEEDDDDLPDPNLPPGFLNAKSPPVTPIQGPIFIKNGTVPVVPLYAYPVRNNGTVVQIPILWTALSLALGLEVRGEIVRGNPCVKRNHQLFCPTAGNDYPLARIEAFIDENKALMKRMYGEFQMRPPDFIPQYQQGIKRTKRKAQGLPGVPDLHAPPGVDPFADQPSGADSYFSHKRQSRQTFRYNQFNDSGRIDSCESKTELVTPYWAANSASKVRAIVNTQHFEQAIHQEVCSSKSQTKRCSGECGCEQKYKWHRLLAYDPDNDCKGIFMDWFIFPSCCVCRCEPAFGNN